MNTITATTNCHLIVRLNEAYLAGDEALIASLEDAMTKVWGRWLYDFTTDGLIRDIVVL
jgi:hypothetical protein